MKPICLITKLYLYCLLHTIFLVLIACSSNTKKKGDNSEVVQIYDPEKLEDRVLFDSDFQYVFKQLSEGCDLTMLLQAQEFKNSLQNYFNANDLKLWNEFIEIPNLQKPILTGDDELFFIDLQTERGDCSYRVTINKFYGMAGNLYLKGDQVMFDVNNDAISMGWKTGYYYNEFNEPEDRYSEMYFGRDEFSHKIKIRFCYEEGISVRGCYDDGDPIRMYGGETILRIKTKDNQILEFEGEVGNNRFFIKDAYSFLVLMLYGDPAVMSLIDKSKTFDYMDKFVQPCDKINLFGALLEIDRDIKSVIKEMQSGQSLLDAFISYHSRNSKADSYNSRNYDSQQ